MTAEDCEGVRRAADSREIWSQYSSDGAGHQSTSVRATTRVVAVERAAQRRVARKPVVVVALEAEQVHAI